MTVEEYLAWEEASTVKHEYLAGMVYALAGATRRHNRIALNIASRLLAASREGPCRVAISDVKLRASDRVFYYPDVMVACGPAPENPTVEECPCLLVEVTSPSTETIDRREKGLVYRGIPSLKEYLLVHHDRRHVERAFRDEKGEWRFADVVGEGRVPVPCPESELSLEEIYEGTGVPE